MVVLSAVMVRCSSDVSSSLMLLMYVEVVVAVERVPNSSSVRHFFPLTLGAKIPFTQIGDAGE